MKRLRFINPIKNGLDSSNKVVLILEPLKNPRLQSFLGFRELRERNAVYMDMHCIAILFTGKNFKE